MPIDSTTTSNPVSVPAEPYYLEPEKETKSQLVRKSIVRNAYRGIQILVLLGLVGMVMYLFATPGSIVDGPSMQPNFCNEDIYLTYKLGSYFSDKPYTYGDVLAFKLDNNHNLIKRVIGLPGDILSIRGGKMYRNGEPINEVYLRDTVFTEPFNGGYLVDEFDYLVPQGKIFVLGDNRPNSIDSRDFGPIDPKVNTINGYVFVVLWPLERARIFDKNDSRELGSCGAATI